MHKSSPYLIAAVYAAMCLIWGSTWIMIKIGLRGAPPMTAVAVRFVIAAAVVSGIIAVRRRKIPRTRGFLLLSLFLGVVHFAIPYVLVYWGEQHISSGLTAVLYSTMPICVALLARIFIGDSLTLPRLAGIGVGFAGVWVIFSDSVSFGGDLAAAGMIAILASVVCASLSTVVVKKYAAGYDPFVTLALPFAIGGLLVTVVAVFTERANPLEFDAATWFTIGYLAVLGSVVAFSFYFWIIKRIDVTVLSYQTFIIPVFAVLIGWIFLRETITIHIVAGAALILAGIALATLRRRKRQPLQTGGRE
jgi:drug/metabolite transporter (DMT)-like permease